MPTILRRPRASADLSEIWEFIAQENIERADAFIDRIDEKFRVLAAQPLMGRDGQRAVRMACWLPARALGAGVGEGYD
jgi:plasmid stabilization system protein ParE